MAFGIWNNLDEVALYYGLERISYETDEQFYNRIKLFTKYKYKTDYYTQVHSIPLQLGLEFYNVMRIQCPIEYTCTIDWEYFTIYNNVEYIKVFINTPFCTLKKVLMALDSSSTFTYSLEFSKYRNLSCKYLVRGSNVAIGRDYIGAKNTTLTHKNIVSGSFRAEDTYVCGTEVSDLQALENDGEYFIDYENGYVETKMRDFEGFFVTYKYYKPVFNIEATDVNLIPYNMMVKYGLNDYVAETALYMLENKVWGK